jgi:RimJ/RimL family protein N-acetyltransferase
MLRLRPYKTCDAAKIVTWIKDEYSFRQWCADRFEIFPITAQMMNDYYASMEGDDTCWQMTAFDETGVVGHFTMRFVDQKKKVIRLGFIIISDEIRNHGVGKELLQLATTYAFTILKVNKITLGVFDNNTAAYHCYKSVGFCEVSSKRNSYLILGKMWKCIELELNRYTSYSAPAQNIIKRCDKQGGKVERK